MIAIFEHYDHFSYIEFVRMMTRPEGRLELAVQDRYSERSTLSLPISPIHANPSPPRDPS